MAAAAVTAGGGATAGRPFAHVALRGPTPSSLHFEAFDRGSRQPAEFDALFTYARIMRERVFVTESKVETASSDTEFDADDKVSRHIYGFIGDAPVAYMRWRVINTPDLGQCVKMERLLVLDSHRRRGIGRQLISFAIQDICQKAQLLKLTISGITVAVTEEPHVSKLFASFGFKVNSDVFTDRGRRRVRMMLSSQDVTKSAQAIAAMAQPKIHFNSGTGVIDELALLERARERAAEEDTDDDSIDEP